MKKGHGAREVRDMNGAAITSLLAEGSSMLAKIRRTVAIDYGDVDIT